MPYRKKLNQEDSAKADSKEALKEALHEWLDEKFALFGKWSMMGIAAGALALLAWLILVMNGWHHP